MSNMNMKPRLWLSTREPKKGDVVSVKAMVMHPMETGMRKMADGALIPRNIVTSFTCTLNGKPVMTWRPDTAVSVNPYLEFKFRALESGDLRMVWADEQGSQIEAIETITVG